MSPQELRIGNYAYHMGDVVIVNSLTDNSIGHKNGFSCILLDDWEGIPLTEKWLIDFGATRVIFGIYKLHGHTIDMTVNRPYYGDISDSLRIPVDFVHDLQNLIFSLSGIELTLKE